MVLWRITYAPSYLPPLSFRARSPFHSLHLCSACTSILSHQPSPSQFPFCLLTLSLSFSCCPPYHLFSHPLPLFTSPRRASLLMPTSIIFSTLPVYCTPHHSASPYILSRSSLLPHFTYSLTLSAAFISKRHSHCSYAESRTI